MRAFICSVFFKKRRKTLVNQGVFDVQTCPKICPGTGGREQGTGNREQGTGGRVESGEWRGIRESGNQGIRD